MAMTLQRAAHDARIRLRGWEEVRMMQQPHSALVRSLWGASRSLTGALLLVAQQEEMTMLQWLWEWTDFLEDYSNTVATIAYLRAEKARNSALSVSGRGYAVPTPKDKWAPPRRPHAPPARERREITRDCAGLLGLIKEVAIQRPDLKLVVMSATPQKRNTCSCLPN